MYAVEKLGLRVSRRRYVAFMHPAVFLLLLLLGMFPCRARIDYSATL